MTIFDHPSWKQLRSFARLSEGRGNVDLLDLPDDLRTLALSVEVNCVACGEPTFCFRARQKSKRARISTTAVERRLFYAATCSSTVNSGCSRSRSAKDAKLAMMRELAERWVSKDGTTFAAVCEPGITIKNEVKYIETKPFYDKLATDLVVAKIDASLKFAPALCREAMLAAREILTKENS